MTRINYKEIRIDKDIDGLRPKIDVVAIYGVDDGYMAEGAFGLYEGRQDNGNTLILLTMGKTIPVEDGHIDPMRQYFFDKTALSPYSKGMKVATGKGARGHREIPMPDMALSPEEAETSRGKIGLLKKVGLAF